MTTWTNELAAEHTAQGEWVCVQPGDDATALTNVAGDVMLCKGAAAPALTTVTTTALLYEGASAPLLTAAANVALYKGAIAPLLTTAHGGRIIAWGPPFVLAVRDDGSYHSGCRRFATATDALAHWRERAELAVDADQAGLVRALEFIHAIAANEGTTT